MQTNFNINLIVELMFLSLATFRLSYMLVYETLPFHIGFRIRHLFGVRYVIYKDEQGENVYLSLENYILYYKNGASSNIETTKYNLYSITEIFTCFWCCSIWSAFLLVLLRILSFELYFIVLILFSSSSLAIYFKEQNFR